MGCASSVDTDDRLQSASNKIIEDELQDERRKMKDVVKILLLGMSAVNFSNAPNQNLFQGAGETGKSTILKQMKLIYGDGTWTRLGQFSVLTVTLIPRLHRIHERGNSTPSRRPAQKHNRIRKNLG